MEIDHIDTQILQKLQRDASLGLEELGQMVGLSRNACWRRVKLMEERMKGAPPLEEVREELAAQIENDAVEQAVSKLLEAAKIDRIDLDTIDAEAISNLSLLSK